MSARQKMSPAAWTMARVAADGAVHLVSGATPKRYKPMQCMFSMDGSFFSGRKVEVRYYNNEPAGWMMGVNAYPRMGVSILPLISTR
jgi:hypothetical protein